MGEARREQLALGGEEVDLDRPVFLRAEQLDLGLALADEAQRHRLHAARRARARQLPPQHGRERESHEIVERAARAVGVDERLVDVARMGESVAYRVARDLVERDALDVDALQRTFFAQHLFEVPRDRLAFAIGVGREDQALRALEAPPDLAESVALVAHLPLHREVLGGIDRAVLLDEIAHVPVARQHLVAAAEVLIDRLRFRRRFDDDDVHHGLRSSFSPMA